MLNFLFDLLYAYDTVFVVKTIYFATLALIFARLIVAIAIGVYFYCKYVYRYRTSLGKAEGIQEENDDDVQIDEHGRSNSV